MRWSFFCEAGVTNAEPSEDNSISAVKMSKIAIAKRGLDRMQLVGRTPISLSLPQSLTMDRTHPTFRQSMYYVKMSVLKLAESTLYSSMLKQFYSLTYSHQLSTYQTCGEV